MTPEDIAVVVAMWRDASSPPALTVVALADRLSGSVRRRAERALWIADAVSLLSTVLHRPAAFTELAADVLAARVPVTTEELADDRDALLGALADLQGPLCPCEHQAWSLAIDLFAEMVSGICLDPFDIHVPTTPTPLASAPARPACDGTCCRPGSARMEGSPARCHGCPHFVVDRHR